MRKKASSFRGKLLCACFLACMFHITAMAQLFLPPSGTVSPMVTKNGYSLQKSTSMSSVKTGQIFTYTITFSIPAGSGPVTLADQIPAPLVIDAVITPAGGYAGVGIPTVNINTSTNNVTVDFGPVPVSFTATFQINVHFPVSNSCNGLRVGNSASLHSAPGTDLKTEDIYTTAIVNNPWKVRKRQFPALLVNNTCQPLTTTYGTTSNTVQYSVDITKTSGVLIGSASLYNVSLRDLLPPGATVIPGTSQSPQLTTTANVPTCSINAAGLVTFNSPLVLDATIANPAYTLTFSVVHNNLPGAACEVNMMELKGNYLCNTIPSADYADTGRVGVRLIPTDSVLATLTKGVTVSGNVPGCTGTYTIRVKNNGPGNMNGYVLRDTFPACLTLGTYTAPAGCSIAIISTSPLVLELSTNAGTVLAPPNFHDYFINFTIGSGCVTSVVNSVTAVSGFTGRAVRSFPMLPAIAKPCITKQICGPASYIPGDFVRFRIRIQNLGAVPLLNVNVTDTLDPASFQYIGNESYYFTNTLVPNQPCGVTPNWTSGISTTNTTGSVNLKWNIDNIPVDCGSVANTVCGQGNNLKTFYIEFTVKIKDTAAIGNLVNFASIQGGPIVGSVVDDVLVTVNGNLNYSINKQVSGDNGSTYGSSADVAPGGTAFFKLSCNNLGIGIVNPVIVDLLPLDNSTGSPVDNFILAPISRNSNMNIRYTSLFSTSHTILPGGQFYSNGTGISTATELGYTVNATAPGWSNSSTASDANFKTYFSQSIGITPAFNYVFRSQVDPRAVVGQRACNTYALRGFGKYMIQYQVSLVPTTPLESGRACVAAAKTECCDPVDVQFPKEICAGFSQQFCAIDTCNSNQYFWDFGDGTPLQTGNCVSHTYTSSGSYSIKLIWRNGCGEKSKKLDIVVKDCKCDVQATAEIIANGNTITADASSSTSSFPIVVYVWEFGDGAVATGQVVTHTYASPGSYGVTLTTYTLTGRGEVCECIDKCRSEISVDPRVTYNRFTCGGIRRDAKAPVQAPAVTGSKITIKATPNPFSDRIYISFDIPAESKTVNAANYRVEFANNNGSVLQSSAVQDFNKVVAFQTSVYASGSYIVMLKNKAGQIQSIKVVKLK